jgi:hypothetical protein
MGSKIGGASEFKDVPLDLWAGIMVIKKGVI